MKFSKIYILLAKLNILIVSTLQCTDLGWSTLDTLVTHANAKGQIKLKSRLASRRFSRKMNGRI